MPKKFAVDLIEDSELCYFSVDSRENKEYTVKRKTGMLKREFNGKWTGHTYELSSPKEGLKFMEKKPGPKFLKSPDYDIPFQPARLLSGNTVIFNYLRSLEEEWKIIFRAQQSRRHILKTGSKEFQTQFNHFSVLIKIWPKGERTPIEVGEGSIREAKFNQDGLTTRIKDIMANHREKRTVQFIDKIPVVLSAGDGAILLHEILGHSLEADYIYQNQSPFDISDIGKRIMPENVTVTTADKYDTFFGGTPCDDDGEVPKSTTLVEKGILKNIICDSFYKDLLNAGSGGHSRVQDFTHQPMPRMFGLYLKPGNYHPQELVESTAYGIYAREFGEGKINFDKNLFYFNIRDARLIENGKRTIPLGNITVRGDIMETLNSIRMVADDFRYDKGISYCFKKGQSINVRVGQPTVKIDNLWVTKENDE